MGATSRTRPRGRGPRPLRCCPARPRAERGAGVLLHDSTRPRGRGPRPLRCCSRPFSSGARLGRPRGRGARPAGDDPGVLRTLGVMPRSGAAWTPSFAGVTCVGERVERGTAPRASRTSFCSHGGHVRPLARRSRPAAPRTSLTFGSSHVTPANAGVQGSLAPRPLETSCGRSRRDQPPRYDDRSFVWAVRRPLSRMRLSMK